jgi:beta-galactosidase
MVTRRDFVTLASGAAVGLLATGAVAATTAKPRFEVGPKHFMLDGQPLRILAGEMHYPRIPRALWRDRMRKLKALGLNTLSSYVFWNAHERREGVYDFSGDLDVAAWIRTAQEEGLWVLLRPGPYVCAEWDNGGFPSWLLNEPDQKIRELDARYMAASSRWLGRLGQEVGGLEIDRGGPILMTQVENEYGSFGADQAYMAAVRDQIRQAGFAGALYTVDPSEVLDKGALKDLFNGVNFGSSADAAKEFARFDAFKSTGPRMCTEFWDGWFDHFGEMHTSTPDAPLLKNVAWMLDNDVSLSFYMAHGGTSFGFDAGANFEAKTQAYQPTISSYDYDAILDEAGRPTPRFEAVGQLLRRYLPPERFGPLPPPERALEIAPFRLDQSAPVDATRVPAIAARNPRTLEQLGQDHGLVAYRHTAARAARGPLKFGEVRDFAIVSVNGRFAATLDRRFRDTTCEIDLAAGDVLEVLVDAMGHVNFGPMIGKDQKGLIGPVTLDGAPLEGWRHHALPLDDLAGLRFSAMPPVGPAFHRGQFAVVEVGYTFLDMRGWGKGYAWVNGHNLGRYWSAGPQRAMFVPAPFLKVGDNSVVVLDLHAGGERHLRGARHQIWDRPGQTQA